MANAEPRVGSLLPILGQQMLSRRKVACQGQEERRDSEALLEPSSCLAPSTELPDENLHGYRHVRLIQEALTRKDPLPGAQLSHH
jgi:hypothetical protein